MQSACMRCQSSAETTCKAPNPTLRLARRDALRLVLATSQPSGWAVTTALAWGAVSAPEHWESVDSDVDSSSAEWPKLVK
jgi:hypothetical protein